MFGPRMLPEKKKAYGLTHKPMFCTHILYMSKQELSHADEKRQRSARGVLSID